jgi:hypothetical protein
MTGFRINELRWGGEGLWRIWRGGWRICATAVGGDFERAPALGELAAADFDSGFGEDGLLG